MWVYRPPPIVVNQYDTLRVHAYNGLGGPLGPEIGTALHTHGNFFNGSNYYDGAVGLTQCPIPSGEELTYEIPVDLQVSTWMRREGEAEWSGYSRCGGFFLVGCFALEQSGTYWIHVSGRML